ncbi:MAG TPA: sigma-70 family RNA polymerase sigma factor [Solirubrobacteraceae bacterium]
MEASAIPASVGLARSRIAFSASLLRIRTDDQLVSVFRAGNDEAFRVIHDRYRARMLAYARQMLSSSGKDPEDAVQEIFMRAYHGLRATDRQLALRAWLYRIAHNRCIDDLRRPQPLAIDADQPPSGGLQDPVAKVEQRDALRRLIADVQQLPGQQRSALLMRELSGMSYSEVSDALGVTVPAVKSLLVRARVGLAQANEARDTACSEIRADLIMAHDRGVRTSGLARRHLRECKPCREFRSEVRGVSRQLAALTPTLGPLGVIANLLGLGGGGGGAAAGGSAVAAGGAAATAGGSAAAVGSAGLLAGGAGHVVTLLAAAMVTAGGAVEIQSTLSTAAAHHSHRPALIAHPTRSPSAGSGAVVDPDGGAAIAAAVTGSGTVAGASGQPASAAVPGWIAPGEGAIAGHQRGIPITEFLDPDMYSPQKLPPVAPSSSPSDPNAAPTAAPGSSTGDAGTGAATNSTSPTGASATGSGAATGPSTASGSGSDSTPASSSSSSSTGESGSSAASQGSSTSASTAPTTASSTGASGTGSGASTSSSTSTGVGKSTTAASSGSVVSFIQHRRSRHRRRLDTLILR